MRPGPRIGVTHFAWAALALAASTAPLGAQSPVAYAEAPAPARYVAAIERGRMIVRAMMAESGTPGMSVAVGVDGRIVWSEGFGYADVELRAPVWQQTRFRIGSVSKPLTAAALGKLVEQGRLDLDAPVQTYVPSFPQKRWPITTRQLAGHLAGIRHYRGEEFLSNKQYSTVVEGLQIFQDDTLLFEPGTRYSYSSYGWNLISAVVEGAAGQEFLSYMRENVFEPLGLTHTVADHTDSIIPQRTSYYQRDENGRVLNAPFVDNSYKWAGGGFLSTPEDLVRFAMALARGDFLRPETVEMLWTSQRTKSGDETGYGIGWRVGEDRDGRRVVMHGGGSVGGRTFLLLFPDEGVAVAMVGNMTQAPTGFTPAWTIAEPFLAPAAAAAVKAESAEPAADVAGEYECTALLQGRDLGAATLRLFGSPGRHWGGMEWENGRDRFLAVSSHARQTRIVAVDGLGRIRNLWLKREAPGLTGTWAADGAAGELTCERR